MGLFIDICKMGKIQFDLENKINPYFITLVDGKIKINIYFSGLIFSTINYLLKMMPKI
jgi:hypothetical protein